MKNLIFLFIAVICCQNILISQTSWTWLNPLPQGNTLNDIKFVDAGTGYAVGEYGTVIKTTNGGLNWNYCSWNQMGSLRRLFIVDPNTFYVTSQFTVWKSTNTGLTWNSYGTTYNPTPLFFINNLTGYIGCSAPLLRKTTDGGVSWNTSNVIPVNNYGIGGLYFFNANTGLITCGNTVQKTTDGGASWLVIYNDNAQPTYGPIAFVNNLIGWLAGSGGQLRKTTDGGYNWVALNSLTSANLNSIAVVDSNNIVITGRYTIYPNYSVRIESSNGGNSWNLMIDTVYAMNSVCTAPNNQVFSCGTRGGLIKSSNSGINWVKLSSGFYNDLAQCFFINSQTGYLTCNNDSVIKTTNSGASWSFINTGFNVILNRVFFVNSNIGYAGGRYGRIIKTTDAGNSWIDLGSISSADIYTIDFINPLTGYVGTTNIFDIKHTTDGGISWDLQTLPIQGFVTKICFVNTNTGFASTCIGQVAKTTNGGINWYSNFNAAGACIRDLVFPNENTGYAINQYVFKTTNCGSTWFQVDSNLGGSGGWGLSFSDADNGFIGGDGIIHRTTNGGTSWQIENLGLPTGVYGCIFAVSPDTCFITGPGGTIIAYKAGLVNIIPVNKNLPEGFALNQNYPNPFNPTTRIKFTVPQSAVGQTFLSVYNILGCKVATLVNEKLSPGTYEVEWDGSNYASGVYFYKLETGDFVQTKKMVLIR